ncbi:hypothetical protein [Micromonospora sp. NPDC048898]|uniref:hypothetical protein n=1 Tax=Micromonospora sp. NPDC048898 TaxID=3364260 RepID=UPI00371EB62B
MNVVRLALGSLKTPGGSRSGDVFYGSGWTASNITALIAVPDLNGDRVPDFWARHASGGGIWVYYATTTGTGSAMIVMGDDVSSVKALG